MVAPSISHVFEAQDGELLQTLKYRLNMVGKFKGLGPPDMVYLIKQKRRGLFKAKIEVGSYHYVYGMYPDSSAVPAAYLRTLIDSQQKGCKIKRGIFAMYDMVSSKDIRVEIEIPGKCHVYSQGQEGRSEISKNEWSFGFMSSILRSIVEPLPHPACRIHDPFPDTPRFDGFRELLQAFVNFTAAQKHDLSIYFGREKDPVEACDRLFGIIARYLISQRRINDLVKLCSPILTFEPNLAALMCDGLLEIYVFQEALTTLATQLSAKPYLVACLVREAKVFLAMDDNDFEQVAESRPLLQGHSNLSMALKISRICVDLCPESFECWHLLGSSLLLSKRFEEVLLILNTIPMTDELETIDGRLSTEDGGENVIPFIIPKHVITQPRLASSSASRSSLFRKPRYKHIQQFFQKYVEHQSKEVRYSISADEAHCKQQELKQIKKLIQINNIALNKRILKSYRLLLALERVLGKEALLRMKAKLFSGGQISTSKGIQIREDTRPKQKEFFSHSTTVVVEDMLRNEDAHYRFHSETDAPKRHARSNSQKAERSYLSSQQDSRHHRSMTLGAMELQQDIPIAPGPKNKGQRVIVNIETLMRQLVLDLGAFKEWEMASKTPNSSRDKVSIFYDQELDYIESALTILLRAVIFDRIGKLQAAISLYRSALQNFADELHFELKIFALFRLMRIYKRTRYDMAAAARFVEIVDSFSLEYGIETWDVIPQWLENTLFKLVGDFGAARYEEGFAEQNRIGERVLIATIQTAKRKNITGSKT